MFFNLVGITNNQSKFTTKNFKKSQEPISLQLCWMSTKFKKEML